MLQGGASDFQRYATNQNIVDEQDNISQGAADEAAGVVDDAMMEKSLGYRNAVTKGRTVTAFSEATRKFSSELEELIQSQDSPSLEVRLAEVEAITEGFYSDFAVDPETGDLRDYLQSPGAMRYLAEAIQTSRPDALAKAQAQVEEQFNEEALSLFSTNVVDQALETGTVDLTAARSLLPATVSEEDVAETAMTAVANAFDALKAAGRNEDATALLAGLRGYVNSPADTGVNNVRPTGKKKAAKSGRVSFDQLASAVQTAESGNDPDAVSPVGAIGLMQTMPGTLRDPGFGVKAAKDDSPEELRRVGRDYLKAMLKRYNGDYVLALSAYNAGPARADEWKSKLKGGTKKRIDAIPFKETRDYARKIMGNLGLIEEVQAPVPSDQPIARLQDPNADPVTEIEQSGQIAEITGLEDIQFSAEQQARINQLYKVSTNELRREWTAQRDEERSENGVRLSLGVLGVGGVTTREDIISSYEAGDIGDGEVMSLVRLFESREDRAEARADRSENRAEREEAKRRRDAANAGTSHIVGLLLRGELTAPEARSAALTFAANSDDPEIAASVLSSISTAANQYENTVRNSPEVRSTTNDFAEKADNAASEVALMVDIPAYNRTNATKAYANIMDRASGDYMRRILEGEEPSEAALAAARMIAREKAAMVEKYRAVQTPNY
jgi:hypothetical protein